MSQHTTLYVFAFIVYFTCIHIMSTHRLLRQVCTLPEATPDYSDVYAYKRDALKKKDDSLPSIAFVVPERDRDLQYDVLRTILKQMQHVDVHIFHIEQDYGLPFNRGLLLNIGFIYAMQTNANFSRVVFQDVDMMPESSVRFDLPEQADIVLYATRASQFEYAKPYIGYFSGSVAFRPSAFYHINGFSNEFWGWGGEDDDLKAAIKKSRIPVTESLGGRFLCATHDRSYVNNTSADYMKNTNILRKRLKTNRLDGTPRGHRLLWKSSNGNEHHILVSPKLNLQNVSVRTLLSEMKSATPLQPSSL